MDHINETILSFGKEKQGILQIIGAVLAFLLTLGTLIHLFHITDFIGFSSYPAFTGVAYLLCKVLAALCTLGGFCAFGIMLLLNPKHMVTAIALGALTLGALFGAVEDLFYYLWQSSSFSAYSYYFNYPYLFTAFIALLTAVAWAFPTVAGFMEQKSPFRSIALIMVLIPCGLFLIYFFAAILTSLLTFSDFLYQLFQYALLIIAMLTVLCTDGKPVGESLREMSAKGGEQQEAQGPRPGQTAFAAQQQQTAPNQGSAPTILPEGYIGIVKLIVLSLITLGIYVFIWIYRTTRFFDVALNRQGSFSPGVEVVLCLFVPFYFIYWVYKQSKAAEEAHRRRGNPGNDDLAIINLLLTIFGFSIIAYALLQDQINKLCLGYTAPPSYERPQQTNTAPQQRSYGYHFDPVTGEPLSKEEPSSSSKAPEKEAPSSAPTTEEATAAANEPEAAETIAEEAKAEVGADPQVVATQLENLKMLKQLLDSGVLTPEEFEKKKRDILNL